VWLVGIRASGHSGAGLGRKSTGRGVACWYPAAGTGWLAGCCWLAAGWHQGRAGLRQAGGQAGRQARQARLRQALRAPSTAYRRDWAWMSRIWSSSHSMPTLCGTTQLRSTATSCSRRLQVGQQGGWVSCFCKKMASQYAHSSGYGRQRVIRHVPPGMHSQARWGAVPPRAPPTKHPARSSKWAPMGTNTTSWAGLCSPVVSGPSFPAGASGPCPAAARLQTGLRTAHTCRHRPHTFRKMSFPGRADELQL